MTDYSKPVGWHCPLSGETFANGAAHAIECNRRDHPGAQLVPVFIPLPEPKPCVIDDLGEVVTVTQSLSRRTAQAFGLLRSSQCFDVYTSVDAVYGDDDSINANETAHFGCTHHNINRIARASARIKRRP